MNKTSGVSFLETKDQYKFNRTTGASRIPAVKLPSGNGYYCKYCGKPVSKGGKRYYCSKECSASMDIVGGFFRRAVLRRDKRTCQLCYKAGDEVDHIIPVCEGGGSCGLENLRTLCRSCHNAETQALRKRLRETKQKAKLVFKRKKK